MEQIIRATTDEEHPALWIDDKRTLAVRLSLSLENVAPTDDVAAAYRDFAAAAASLGGATPGFAVFAREEASAVLLDAFTYKVRSEPTDPALLARFQEWLGNRVAELAARQSAPPTAVGAGTAGADEEVSESEVSGFHVLLGAASWLAPIPHQLGLVHLVTVEDGADLRDLAIVPLLGGATPDLAAIVLDGDVLTVGFVAGAPYASCRATLSTKPNFGDTLLQPSGFIGRIEPARGGDGEGEAFGRLVRRFEQKSGSLFTGHLAAGEIVWPAALDAAASPPPNLDLHSDDGRFVLGCLAWHAASLLGTAFDTLLLAVRMPGREGRDGQVLGPFLNILVKNDFFVPTGQGATLPALAGRPESQRRAAFRTALRFGIGAAVDAVVQSLRVAGAATPDGEARWKGARDALWRLAGLEPGEAPLASAFLRYAVAERSDPDKSYETLLSAVIALGEAGTAPTRDDLARRLATELAALNETLLGEAGAERALVMLLRRPEVVAAVVAAWDGSTEDQSADAVLYEAAVARLVNLLAGGLNGAEAARQTVGSLFTDRATVGLSGTADPIERISEAGYVWNFWTERLGAGRLPPQPPDSQTGPDERPFLHLPHDLDELFRGMADPGNVARAAARAREAIDRAADAMREDVRARLLETDGARFVPDAAPGPLLTPIALDTAIDDDGGVDPFTASFAGLSVLVRIDDGPWAHACLAEPLDPKTECETHDPRTGTTTYCEPEGFAGEPRLTIAPLPPAVVDGRRELFVSFSGLPFGSHAYSDTIGEAEQDRTVVPFFLPDYPQDPGAFARLDPLAYGTRVAFAVHVVGRSGLLPPTVRAPSPWLPKPAPDSIDPTASATVSRRTAIGRAVFGDPPGPQRIGAWPDDVLPLSHDYPRLAVEPDIAASLLRNADGTGAIALPTGIDETVPVALRDIRLWGVEKATLTVAVGLSPIEADEASAIAVTIGAAGLDLLRLEFVRLSATAITLRIGDEAREIATRDGDTAAWLQLGIDGGAISLANPNPEKGSRQAAGRPAPDDLLLVGSPPLDEAAMAWRSPFAGQASVELSLPRMTFADFMRWTNNDNLADKALGGAGGAAPDERRKCFDRFRVLLVALDMDRIDNPEAAGWLDRLPDLAVSSVRLSAVPVDTLVLPSGQGGTSDPRAVVASAELAMPSLWELLDHPELASSLDEGRIVAILRQIDRKLRRRLALTPQTADPRAAAGLLAFDHAGDTLRLPGGLTVRLSARTIVDAGLFGATAAKPAVIDPRLLQYAVGPAGATTAVFEGTPLLIETMIGPLARPDRFRRPDVAWLQARSDWAGQRSRMLQHHPSGSSQSYHLSLAPNPVEHWAWRQVGTVTTRTQAWRFGGRPIYSWIDPSDFVDRSAPRVPRQATLPMAPKADQGAFFRFEDELFVGRDDDDANPRTVVLRPLGHETRLVEMAADPPRGATLHRHGVEIRSRYEGAMSMPERHGFCEAWMPTDARAGNPDRWTRIAVLATRPTGELTRPQLRALMPLTRRPGATYDDATMAPPVLALMQEEPLAFGGLAARIGSEIHTGIGYAAFGRLGDPSGEVVIAPGDLRREIGPDPGLSFRPMEEQAASTAVLVAEGPIGLTFDRDATANAGFPNAALMLHPRFADPARRAELEENFLSVALRRYLDPAWLVPEASPPAAVGGVVPPCPVDRDTLWISAGAELTIDFGPEAPEPPAPIALTAVHLHDGKVEVHPHALDDSVAATAEAMQLCTLPPEQGQCAVLLIPQEKGRLALSIFWFPGQVSDYPSGSGLAPVMLASIELGVPKGLRAEIRGATAIRPTAASATTALNWVRTNPDFARVSIEEPPGRIPTTALTAAMTADSTGRSLSFASLDKPDTPVWVRASQAIRRVPVHRQRQMVVLLGETLSGIGREIERPLAARLAPARTLALPPATYTDPTFDTARLVEIEMVAELVGWLPNGEDLPARYRHGCFDLVALGEEVIAGSGMKQRFLFRLRHVSPVPDLAQVKTIGATLHLSAVDRMRIEFGDLPPKVREIFFVLVLDGGMAPPISAGSLTAWAIDDAGAMRPIFGEAEPPGGALAADRIEALALSIDAIKPTDTGADSYGSAAYFETSLLVGPVDGDDPWRFRFDWLFGSEAMTLDGFADPVRMAARREPQARIVSVSPPLPIRPA